MGRVYSLVLAVPIVLLALLELRAGPTAARGPEQGFLTEVAPVSTHGPGFSSAQDPRPGNNAGGDNDEREDRGITDGQRIFRYIEWPHAWGAVPA